MELCVPWCMIKATSALLERLCFINFAFALWIPARLASFCQIVLTIPIIGISYHSALNL